jgi:hypothetical protein
MSDTISTENAVIDDGSSGDGSQRRLLLVVGGAALLLVLGLGAYFLFLSGGDEEDLGTVPNATGSQPVEDGKKDKKAKKDDKVSDKVNVKFTVGRDPFAPLAVEAVVEPPPEKDTTSDTSSTDTTKGSGTKSGTGGNTPAPTTSPAPAPTQDAVSSYEVTLRSVDLKKNTAVIEVDGKRYLLKVKDLFPNTKTGPFKLTGVSETGSGKATATVVFGSDAPVELLAKDTVVFKP